MRPKIRCETFVPHSSPPRSERERPGEGGTDLSTPLCSTRYVLLVFHHPGRQTWPWPGSEPYRPFAPAGCAGRPHARKRISEMRCGQAAWAVGSGNARSRSGPTSWIFCRSMRRWPSRWMAASTRKPPTMTPAARPISSGAACAFSGSGTSTSFPTAMASAFRSSTPAGVIGWSGAPISNSAPPSPGLSLSASPGERRRPRIAPISLHAWRPSAPDPQSALPPQPFLNPSPASLSLPHWNRR